MTKVQKAKCEGNQLLKNIGAKLKAGEAKDKIETAASTLDAAQRIYT